MIPGIKIIDDLHSLNSRIFLNSGVYNLVCNFHDTTGETIKYNGYAPNTDWRLCTKEEKKILVSQDIMNSDESYIRISSLPLESFSRELEFLRNSDTYSKGIRKSLTQGLLQKIEKYMCEFFLLKGDATFFGLRILNNINSPTVTFDENTGQYIGLHIDCWDGDNITDEVGIRNRICINLGKYPRYFFFINLDLGHLCGLLKKDKKDFSSKSELAYDFLSTHYTYPVVRIKLEPGEYYLAPTEQVLHDASFDGKEDITTTMLGYFS
jgi:hypothetical protein